MIGFTLVIICEALRTGPRLELRIAYCKITLKLRGILHGRGQSSYEERKYSCAGTFIHC